jgi:hypothetical protein
MKLLVSFNLFREQAIGGNNSKNGANETEGHPPVRVARIILNVDVKFVNKSGPRFIVDFRNANRQHVDILYITFKTLTSKMSPSPMY